jgi:hypothetical protein
MNRSTQWQALPRFDVFKKSKHIDDPLMSEKRMMTGRATVADEHYPQDEILFEDPCLFRSLFD